MALDLLVTATLGAKTNLPKDNCVNNFVFNSAAATDPGQISASIFGAVDQFYNGINTTGIPLAGYFSPGLQVTGDLAPLVLRMYDITGKLGGQPHGSPVAENLGGLAARDSGQPLPHEVTAVMTLRGTGASTAPIEAADGADANLTIDRPRQKRTGRLYLGPLNYTAVAVTTNSEAKVSGSLITAALDAAQDLASAGNASTPAWAWRVWSRVDGVTRNVVSAEVDNAFDTQRRRGGSPTVRVARATL